MRACCRFPWCQTVAQRRAARCGFPLKWVELKWLEDAEVLGRIGRGPMAGVLQMLAPVVAQEGARLGVRNADSGGVLPQ